MSKLGRLGKGGIVLPCYKSQRWLRCIDNPNLCDGKEKDEFHVPHSDLLLNWLRDLVSLEASNDEDHANDGECRVQYCNAVVNVAINIAYNFVLCNCKSNANYWESDSQANRYNDEPPDSRLSRCKRILHDQVQVQNCGRLQEQRNVDGTNRREVPSSQSNLNCIRKVAILIVVSLQFFPCPWTNLIRKDGDQEIDRILNSLSEQPIQSFV